MPQRLARRKATAALTAAQAQSLAVDKLARALPVAVDSYQYGAADLYGVLLATAAERRGVESVCRALTGAPSSNLMRHYMAKRLLAPLDPDALEARCQALLTWRLPADLPDRAQALTVDLTPIPCSYYGDPAPAAAPAAAAGQARRGEAKASTTRFHCYATAFVLRDGRCVTLAATFVWAADDLLDVLNDLLGRVRPLGVPRACTWTGASPRWPCSST